MKKFVIYRRLSKEDKSRNQHGFDSQMLDIQDYLKDIGEYEIVGDCKEFVSGGADVKPELEKALQLCREHKAILLVSRLDRLSRRVSQISRYMEEDVTFKVSTMPSANNLQLHIFAALAEEERATIRRRVQRGLEAAKAKGKKFGGENPQWRISFNKNKSLGLHSHKSNSTSFRVSGNTNDIAQQISRLVKITSPSNYKELTEKVTLANITTPRGKPFSVTNLANFCKRNNIQLG